MKNNITVHYKDIPWYEWKYQVSSLWEIIRLPDIWSVKLKVLKPYTNWIWSNLWIWLQENWNRKRFLVNILIANAFIKNPKQFKYVWHKDWNKFNLLPSNLFWTNKDSHRNTKYSKDTMRLLKFSVWYANLENRNEKDVEEWYWEFIINNN